MLYEVRFLSLFQPGRALSFPCDREGHVDIDALTAEQTNAGDQPLTNQASDGGVLLTSDP